MAKYTPHSGDVWAGWEFHRANDEGGMVATHHSPARNAAEPVDRKPSVHVKLPNSPATLCGISLEAAPQGHKTYGLNFKVHAGLPAGATGCARCRNNAPANFAAACTYAYAAHAHYLHSVQWAAKVAANAAWAQQAIQAQQLVTPAKRSK